MGVNAGGLLNLMNSDDDRMLVQRKLRAAQRLVTHGFTPFSKPLLY